MVSVDDFGLDSSASQSEQTSPENAPLGANIVQGTDIWWD